MIRRRNRKKRNMNGFMALVPFSMVAVLVAATALGYVWLGCRCDSLGREIKTLEARKTDLERKYMNEENRWMRMKSPLSIEEALAKFHIAMTWPGKDQIVRLSDNAPEKQPTGGNQYASRRSGIGRYMLNE